MYSFKFENIGRLIDDKQLYQGCFLCIWHAHKIPPHIGILINGFYYSLKVNGKDFAIPVTEIVKLINRKEICTVFVKVKFVITKEEVEYIFSNYISANASQNTCLSPISEVFMLNEKVNVLADLLNSFKKQGLIGEIFGLNLVRDFRGIPFYGKEEIEARLKALSKTL